MKAQAYAQSPIRARIEAVSTAADRADALLAQMAQFDATVSIRATLKSLENRQFPTPGATPLMFALYWRLGWSGITS